MRRLVLDTNVWVSAFLTPGGTCHELLLRLLRGGVEIAISSSLMDELQRVLKEKVGATGAEVARVVSFIESVAVRVEPHERLRIVLDDQSRYHRDRGRAASTAVAALPRHSHPIAKDGAGPVVGVHRATLSQPPMREA